MNLLNRIFFIFNRENKLVNYINYEVLSKPERWVRIPRGRPIKSEIRQNIVEILYFMKQGYGYDIYKAYRDIFPKVTMRSIYYHLKKGVSLGEFKVDKIEKEKGDYSWGGEAEKIYYALGENAKPIGNDRVKEYFDKKKR